MNSHRIIVNPDKVSPLFPDVQGTRLLVCLACLRFPCRQLVNALHDILDPHTRRIAPGHEAWQTALLLFPRGWLERRRWVGGPQWRWGEVGGQGGLSPLKAEYVCLHVCVCVCVCVRVCVFVHVCEYVCVLMSRCSKKSSF
jgi:hypothetical protein